MKSRIYALLGINTRSMWISTFHSMCARILREHIECLGYKRLFQIIDDDDSVQMIKSILKRLNLDQKLLNPRTIKNIIMNMKYDETVIEHYEEPLKGQVKKYFSNVSIKIKRK
jgi:DNA helicase II / ATP-dependent DNA helicase PcrA